jgi:hypothetical protein
VGELPETNYYKRIIRYSQKNSKRIIEAKGLQEDYSELSGSCEKIVAALNTHADFRSSVLKQREEMMSSVKDNASCPKCEGPEYLNPDFSIGKFCQMKILFLSIK